MKNPPGWQLPRSWSRAPLSELCAVVRERLPPATRPDLPFIGLEHVQPHSMRLLGTAQAQDMRSAAVHFEKGDVLYGRLRPYLNKVITADFEGLCSAEFIPLTARDGIAPRYLQYRLNATDFVSFASHLREGDRPRVDWDQVGDFHIEVPPSLEQRRIVDAIESHLSRLDEAERALGRVRCNLERFRAAVLQAAVEGRLVPTEAELAREDGRDYEPATELLTRILAERRRRWEESELARLTAAGKQPKGDKWKAKYRAPGPPNQDILPRLPDGWCWSTVDGVGDVLLGRQRAPQYLTGRYSHPYLRVANVKDDAIDLSDVEQMDFDPTHLERYRLLPGDILVSEGQSPELVGQSAIYRGGIDGLCFQKTLHRFRPALPGPSSEFAQIVFRAHVRAGIFSAMASITTNIAHLTLEKFKAAPFPLPPASEQQRIVLECQRLMTLADDVEQLAGASRRRLRRLRQSVLRWAFEGRLVDQDPNDEPASALLERLLEARVQAANATRPRRGRRARKVG